MASLKTRLLAAHDDFLSALQSGESAVYDFEERWGRLSEDIEVAAASDVLDDETIALAHIVSMHIEIVASSFGDVLTATEVIHEEMAAEMDELFANTFLGPSYDEGEVAKTDDPTTGAASFSASRAPSLVFDSDSDDDSEDALPNFASTRKRLHDDTGDLEWDIVRMHKRSRCSLRLADNASDVWLWDDLAATPRESAQTLSDYPSREVRPLPGRALSAPPSILPISQTLRCPSREVRPLPGRAVSAPPCILPISQTNRPKRRSSELDTPVSQKRSRTDSVELTDQTHSNPPIPSNDFEYQVDYIFDWASTFNVVEPATFAPPEASGPFVFEMFNQWHISDDICDQPVTDINAATAKVLSTPTNTSVPSLPVTTEDMPLTSMSCTLSPSHTPSLLSTPSSTNQKHSHTLAMLLPHVEAAEYATKAHSRRDPFSPSFRTPPPTFEHAIAYPDGAPPSYTANDQILPTDLDYFPPPPYCPFGEKSSHTHGALLDALAGISPSKYLESSSRHLQLAQIGFAIAV